MYRSRGMQRFAPNRIVQPSIRRGAWLPLSPMQFAAKDFKELLPILFPKQLYAIAAEFAFNAILALDGNTYLSINGKKSLLVSNLYGYRNLRALFHNQRAMGESMRGNGRDDQGLHAWRQNGTACRQRVCSRAGRRRDDQGVSLVVGHSLRS